MQIPTQQSYYTKFQPLENHIKFSGFEKKKAAHSLSFPQPTLTLQGVVIDKYVQVFKTSGHIQDEVPRFVISLPNGKRKTFDVLPATYQRASIGETLPIKAQQKRFLWLGPTYTHYSIDETTVIAGQSGSKTQPAVKERAPWWLGNSRFSNN